MNCRFEDFLNDFDLKEGDSFKANVFFYTRPFDSGSLDYSCCESAPVKISRTLHGYMVSLSGDAVINKNGEKIHLSNPSFLERTSIFVYERDETKRLIIASCDCGKDAKVHLVILSKIWK